MRGTIFILLLICCNSGNSQEKRVITGKIVDVNSREPLEFVNLKFQGKTIGTTTTTSGHFILSYEKSEVNTNDVLEISFVGYESRKLTMDRLKRFSSKPITIALTPSPFELGEVVLSRPKREKRMIGHRNLTSASMGYWEGEDAIGGEIASVVPIPDRGTKLKHLRFKVIENRSDSLSIRVKFYHYDGGDPQKEVTGKEIVHMITQKEGWVNIPLQPYDIEVSDDILVSIQLVEAFGGSIYLSLSASAYGGMSFIRERKLLYWRPQKTTCVGFKIESSVPIRSNKSDLRLSKRAD